MHIAYLLLIVYKAVNMKKVKFCYYIRSIHDVEYMM